MRPTRPGERLAAVLIWLGALAAFAAWAARYFPYTIDDAYISLRYARNLAAGYGLTFNVGGPRLEGYTNFLWVVIEAARYAIRGAGDPLPFVKILGLASGTAALAAAYGLGRRLFGPAGGAAATLALALTGNFTLWAVAGLETPLYLCAVLTALALTVDAGRSWRAVAFAAAAWLVAALTRPEGVIVGGVMTAAAVVMRPGGGRRGRWLVMGAALAAGYGAYFAWRAHYFGMTFPNTFYARAGATPTSFAARLRGLAPFVLFALPAVAFAYYGARETAARGGRWLALAAAATFALAFAAKREWMPGYRYELPCAATLAVLAAGGVATLARRLRPGWAVALAAAAVLYCIVPGLQLRDTPDYTARLDRAHVALGKWMSRAAPPGFSLAAWDMGALPYFAEAAAVYDINPEGLLSAETTRRGYDPAYFIRRAPTFFVLFSSRADAVAAPRGCWVWPYYRSAEFQRRYRYLFTFTFGPRYNLRVYARADVPLTPAALREGGAAAARSRLP